MPAKLTELTLIFRRERIRFDGGDTCIMECEEPSRNGEAGADPIIQPATGKVVGTRQELADFFHDRGVIVKANVPDGELVGGLSYRFYGHWVEHDKYGRQFAAKTFVRCQPHGKAGVIRYLITTCAGHGVGHATAAKLWEKFQGDAVRILREEPEVAAVGAGMSHFTEEKAVAASLLLKEESALEAVHIDLIDILGGRGFPHGTAKLAVAEWGNRAAMLIKRNPYLLMRFPRCGYLRTDQLYLDNGGRPAALKRQALAAWYAIARDSEGHTWHRPEVCEAGLRARVSGAEVRPLDAMILARRAGLLTVHRNGDGVPWLAESRKAENERTVAEHVREMLKAPCQWPEVAGLDISEHQAGELAKALRASIALFGGSPGCLRGDTIIFDPTDGTRITVRNRHKAGKEFRVFALGDDGEIVVTKAESPRRYQAAMMLKFTFGSGRTITVTEGHRFWNGEEFVRARDVVSHLQRFGAYRLPSIAESSLAIQRQDDRRSMRIGGDCLAGCLQDRHQYDGQPPFLEEADRLSLPSQGDVLQRNHASLRLGAVERRDTNSAQDEFFHRSKKDCVDHFALHFEDESECSSLLGFLGRCPVWHAPFERRSELKIPDNRDQQPTAFSSLASAIVAHASAFSSDSMQEYKTDFSEQCLYVDRTFRQSDADSNLTDNLGIESSDRLCVSLFLQCSVGPSVKYTNYDSVVKVEDAGIEPYYDFHVPQHENYWAEGFFHHNTGKTYTAARLIGRIIELCGSDSIAVACPTGKAAVRISEALDSYGVKKTASTIHRLLGVASRTAGEGWGFMHDESSPLPFKYVVIDEGSMIDTDLFAALLRAMPAGAHLLIVGDVNQLPPVGHGAPLRDMLSAGVPAGELREIHRNAGTIVRVCAAIRDGKPWKFDRELDPDAGHNMKLTVTRSNAESQDEIVVALKRLAGLGFDPVWDCQVLVSVNRKSELSRVEMNRRLQGELNPTGERVNGCPFRVGDKIIRIRRNTLMPCVEDCGPDENREAVDGKVLVCNGEMGRTVAVEAKRIFARFPAPQRFIVIPFGKAEENENGDDEEAGGNGCDFDLGYACTVHKFQGSESKIILYGLDDSGGAMRLGCRELFYTGISRGKLFDLVFGKSQTAAAMCLRRIITKRKTFLAEMIKCGEAGQG